MRLWPTLLARTLIMGNLRLLLPTLLLGLGLYLLTDLFEKLDNFLEAEVSFGTVCTFFAYKTPMIISQLLPVIFLLAVVIQLCLMARNRELTALQAGGISLIQPARVLFCCGIAFACIQMCFSEVLGVIGERESTLIWQQEVRHRNLEATVFKDVWFRDGAYIVRLATLAPGNKGTGMLCYEVADDNITVKRILEAKTFTGATGRWIMHDVTDTRPETFAVSRVDSIILPIQQDPATFRLFVKAIGPRQLPIWQLSDVISQLSSSGSNVERLVTAFHNKISYACSLIVMALIGVAIVSWTSNIYLATTAALLSTFVYFALFTICTSLGEKGSLPPVLAAWLADILGLILSGARLISLFLVQRRQ